jgi:hypothetical protein
VSALNGQRSGVAYIVQELRSGVSLNIVRVKITPAELHVNPEFVAGCAVQNVLVLKWNINARELNIEHLSKLTSVTSEGLAMFHL